MPSCLQWLFQFAVIEDKVDRIIDKIGYDKGLCILLSVLFRQEGNFEIVDGNLADFTVGIEMSSFDIVEINCPTNVNIFVVDQDNMDHDFGSLTDLFSPEFALLVE